MIPVSKPSVGDSESELINEVLASGWLGQGRWVELFEKKVSEITGRQNVIAVNSGTSALILALEVSGIRPGDEVIVPSLTFCAGVQAILATGANPVFCEVDADTLNIDTRDAASRITPATRAIMPVHFSGQACDLDSLYELSAKHNLAIIEDAAHAFGSSYKGRMIGSDNRSITCFSFDPIKNITCGEGGAIVTGDKRMADKLKRMRMLGIDRDSWYRNSKKLTWYYEVTEKGYRNHMSNINAAIGLAQLAKMDDFKESRRRAVNSYNTAFSHLPGLQTIKWNIGESFPFSYLLRITNGRRDELMNHLAENGVDSGINYIPNHLQPLFNSGTSLPVTEQLYGEIITLPLFSDITPAQTFQVIEAVSSFFS